MNDTELQARALESAPGGNGEKRFNRTLAMIGLLISFFTLLLLFLPQIEGTVSYFVHQDERLTAVEHDVNEIKADVKQLLKQRGFDPGP